MAQSLARSWVASAARCTRRARIPTLAVAQVRHSSFAKVEEKPLETVEDWTSFQLKKAEYQTLSAYSRTHACILDLTVTQS